MPKNSTTTARNASDASTPSQKDGAKTTVRENDYALLTGRLLALILTIYGIAVFLFCLVNYWPQPE